MNDGPSFSILFFALGIIFMVLMGMFMLKKPRICGQVIGVLVALISLLFASISVRMFFLNHKLMHHGVEVEAELVDSKGCYGDYTFKVPNRGMMNSSNLFSSKSSRWKTSTQPPPKHLTALYLAENPEYNGPKNQKVGSFYYIFLILGLTGFVAGLNFIRSVRNRPDGWSPFVRERSESEVVVRDVLGKMYKDRAEKVRRERRSETNINNLHDPHEKKNSLE